MKKKRISIVLASIAIMVASVFIAPSVSAKERYTCSGGPNAGRLMIADTHDAAVRMCDGTWNGTSYTEEEEDFGQTMANIINVLIAIVGFIAIIMIIIGGIMYTTSAGDAGKAKKAKDTIMYGIIGLVVALLAFAIVNFVLGNL